MLELTVENQLPIIASNFELVKASLTENIAKYKGMIVTTETLKDAKADQIMLGKIEKKIDEYRKSVKQEVEKPIKEFEANCKILIALVSDAKLPLKDSIQVFDDAERDKKRVEANGYINEAIKANSLNEKYGSQLMVLPEYMNVAMTSKKLKIAIEEKAFLLLNEMTQEIEKMQIINDTIENVNKGIDAKLSLEDFKYSLENSTSVILNEINSKAERIKANELKAVADKAAAAEKIVQDRIAKAEREAVIKAENIKIQAELAEIAETERNNKILNSLEVRKTEEPKQINVSVDLQREPKVVIKDKPLLFIEMRLEGTLEELMQVSRYLKAGGYNYKKLSDGKL